MSAGEYTAGAVILLCELAFVGAGSWLVVRHRLAHLRGLDRALALAIVFTAGLIAAHVIPLCLTILSRPAVLVTAALLAGLALLDARRAGPAPEEPADDYPESPPEGRLERIVGLGVPLYACVLAAAYLTTVATAAVLHVDFMEFHGPHVAHWIQEGSLWNILSLYPTHHTGYDPHNGEVILLAVALPWQSDFLFRFAGVPYLFVTAAALTSMGRHLGAGARTSVLFATLVVFLPTVLLLALITAKPDTLLMATFATGALFLVRHWRTGRRSDLVMAGLALGLAFGSKWNGLTAVVILVFVWTVARLVSGLGPRRVARETAGVGLVTGAAGGIWFVRNAVATGNPVFPVKVEAGGVTLLDAPKDLQLERYGDSLSDYLTDFESMREHILPPIYHNMMGPAGVFVVLLLLAGAVVAFRALARSREDRLARSAAFVAAAALVIAVAYVFTPFTAQTFNGVPARAWVTVRYGAPALLLAAPLAAWMAARSGRLRPLLIVAAAVALVEVAHRSLRGRFAEVPVGRVALVAVGLLALAAAGLAAHRALDRLDVRQRRLALGGAALLALVAVLGVGYEDQRRFMDRRYAEADPTFAWVDRHAPEGARIGLVGEWIPVDYSPALAMYGPRLRNEVMFVGPDREGIMDEYRSAGALGRRLERERLDLVLVQDRPQRGPNETWLRSLGYTPVATGKGLVLMRPAQGGSG